MDKTKIVLYRNRFRVGDFVSTRKRFETGSELVKAQIFAIYPKYAIVTEGKYRWCVHWTDLMEENN